MMFYTAKDTWMPCEWQKDTTNLLVGFCKSEDLIYMQKQMHLFSKNTIKAVSYTHLDVYKRQGEIMESHFILRLRQYCVCSRKYQILCQREKAGSYQH